MGNRSPSPLPPLPEPPWRVAERDVSALLAALQALPDDPEANDQVVKLGEGLVRLERSPEPGMDLRLTPVVHGPESGEWIVRTFGPVEARPGSYPDELPFLSGIPVMVWEPIPRRSVMALWNNPPEPRALLSSILSISREQGWVGVAVGVAGPPPQFISLSRGRAQRVISLLSAQGETMLSVSDTLGD